MRAGFCPILPLPSYALLIKKGTLSEYASAPRRSELPLSLKYYVSVHITLMSILPNTSATKDNKIFYKFSVKKDYGMKFQYHSFILQLSSNLRNTSVQCVCRLILSSYLSTINASSSNYSVYF